MRGVTYVYGNQRQVDIYVDTIHQPPNKPSITRSLCFLQEKTLQIHLLSAKPNAIKYAQVTALQVRHDKYNFKYRNEIDE